MARAAGDRGPYIARPASNPATQDGFDEMSGYAGLTDFIDRHRRLFVLTGAGCSTGSGIPDYRDGEGQWKRAQPVTYQAFMGAGDNAPALLGAQPHRLAAHS